MKTQYQDKMQRSAQAGGRRRLCPKCKGAGLLKGRKPCQACAGTGWQAYRVK